MLKYVPFYFWDFFADPRVQALTSTEQQQWLMILAQMMTTEAVLPDNPKFLAKLLDISSKNAAKLLQKLKALKLLNPTGKMLLQLANNRLTAEYNYALNLWMQKSQGGKRSAAQRWNDKTLNKTLNADID